MSVTNHVISNLWNGIHNDIWKSLSWIILYLICDGTADDAPTKLPITDLAKREHFDAEHNVANAILYFTPLQFNLLSNIQQMNLCFKKFWFSLWIENSHRKKKKQQIEMEIVQNCVFVFLSITDEEKTNFCYCRDPIRIVQKKSSIFSVFFFFG